MTTTAAARHAMGAHGEAVARRHVEGQGLVVLDRNWRCEHGEVDLVLRDGDALVVCEVKTRSADQPCGSPHEAVTPEKLQRLQRLAEAWQLAHGVRAPEVRVDLVAVVLPPRGAARVEHVRGLD